MGVVIISAGASPTGRSLVIKAALEKAGAFVNYRNINDLPEGSNPDCIIVDDLASMDYTDLEARFANALIYGTSHPEMFIGHPDQLPPTRSRMFEDFVREKPKNHAGMGPRNKWGKL